MFLLRVVQEVPTTVDFNGRDYFNVLSGCNTVMSY